jgi:hypothetical protein
MIFRECVRSLTRTVPGAMIDATTRRFLWMDDKSVGVALTYLESVRYMCGKDSKAR